MLSDLEMEQNAAHLSTFRQTSSQHQETLGAILEKYSSLMEDYRRMKSDFEEERDARERYKQMARGGERNPFVLVLVDGDGYIFDDDMVSAGAEGGQRAAHLLNETIKRSLRDRGLDHCRIMVRIYANLAGLSKTLSRSKLAGPEKRSLAPFVANFNRSAELFDFVDAGELKENADFKLRAMFRLYAENSQCRHIYFAGCHDVGYINDLTPFTSNGERITLVRTPAFHPEFNKLNLPIETFSGVFRRTPLDSQPVQPLAYRTPSAAVQTPPFTRSVCNFYQQGNCKYGDTCRNLHVRPNGDTAGSAGKNPNDMRSWRGHQSSDNNNGPFTMSPLAKSDNDFMNGHMRADTVQIDPANQLPRDVPSNKIALNDKGHRLDAYIPEPTAEEKRRFSERTARAKLCNNYQLVGDCPKGAHCPYDHDPIDRGLRNVLKQAASTIPCPKRGACRRANCTAGHICQKAGCKMFSGKGYCKHSAHTHAQDLSVAQYVDAVAVKGIMADDISVAASRDYSSSTPPNEDEEEVRKREQESNEGAMLDLDGGASVD